ncbi:MAG: glycoside hydrolase family 3 C-terminal domain-containing protein [Acidimicrobiales bacterium]|nr:glycoside hydrolase family 3 C-terminal domain-containing protein [Acidimicrobiales bacterium]
MTRFTDPATEARIDDLLTQLDLDEQAALTAGKDSWRIAGIPRLGIGDLKVTDGPTGARGDLTTGARAVCFPVGSAIGATWDTDLVGEIATVLADEARSKGAEVLLGPTVNIHRHPLAGRNFECYSEDPELTARLCVAFIAHLQAGGVGASLKHFVCNDSEFERHSISSEVDERTLREVYLRPFESAVAAADPWTIMAAYNKLNGTHATEHHWLQVELLKEEWEWPGMLVSDWYATHDTVASGNGGLDLQMPGPALQFGPELAKAVRDGSVDEVDVADKARRVLRLYARTGKLNRPDAVDETSIDTPERRALARRAATSSTVLLTNDGVLPLGGSPSIAVIGPNATPGRIQGGGSSEVTPHYSVSPLDGICERFDTLGGVTHARGVGAGLFGSPIDPALLDGGGFDEVFFGTPDLSGDPYRSARSTEASMSFFGAAVPDLGLGSFSARWTARFTPDQSGDWRFTVAGAGRTRVRIDGDAVVDDDTAGPKMAIWVQSLEPVSGVRSLDAGTTYDLAVELRADERGVLPHLRFAAAPPDPAAETARAVAAARSADVAVVVVGTSSDYETEGEDRSSFELPAGQDELIERVAAANPNTVVVVNAGSPIPMPWVDSVRAVLWAWYPGQEFGNALADVLSGDADPGGRLPTTFARRLQDTPAFTSYPGEFGTVRYSEGLFVGHRWYDARDIEPLFPFGHGLSYATFEIGEVTAAVDDDGAVTVRAAVTNVSARAGSEVVQVYVEPPAGPPSRPVRQLAGFAKVHVDAGASTTATVEIPARALAHWDPSASVWQVAEGAHTLWVGRSSRDLTEWVTIDPGARTLATPQP